MDQLACMRLFVAVAEAGSLSGAAQRLGLSLAAVSRQLAQTEERLGVRLAQRTTRQLQLTEEGRTYFEGCKRIMGDVEDLELTLAQRQVTPSGRLVVTGTTIFGRRFLAPLIPAFVARYPRIEVDLTLSDRAADLVGEGIDLAVRIGNLRDSSLVARKVGAIRRCLVAAPAYLERFGEPATPDDLARHNCLIWTPPSDAADWRFKDAAGREILVPVRGNIRSDSADAVIEAAVRGVGIARAPSWRVRELVAQGQLRVVLQAFDVPRVPIQSLSPETRLRSAKVRAFVDFLLQSWRIEDFAQLDPSD